MSTSVVGNLLSGLNAGMPRLKRIVPVWLKRFVIIHFLSDRTEIRKVSPDRVWLETEILPRIAQGGFGSVLFVGCAPYTFHYENILKDNVARYVTLDINPSARV